MGGSANSFWHETLRVGQECKLAVLRLTCLSPAPAILNQSRQVQALSGDLVWFAVRKSISISFYKEDVMASNSDALRFNRKYKLEVSGSIQYNTGSFQFIFFR